VIAALVVIGLPQFAHAAVIDLVSQSYRIHAMGFIDGGPTVNYDVTTDVPNGRTDEYHQLVPFFGSYFLSTSAAGGITPTAFVQAESETMDTGFGDAVVAEARAAITFRPLVSNVVVTTENPEALRGFSGLYDETAGAAVLAFGAFITPAAYNVSLDLQHLYTFYASTIGLSAIGGNGARLSISAGPASVPESERTLTFLVVGLGALLLIARSQTFRLSH
jgi:hypothetical protein